jgi:hypothetical protein
MRQYIIRMYYLIFVSHFKKTECSRNFAEAEKSQVLQYQFKILQN